MNDGATAARDRASLRITSEDWDGYRVTRIELRTHCTDGQIRGQIAIRRPEAIVPEAIFIWRLITEHDKVCGCPAARALADHYFPLGGSQ